MNELTIEYKLFVSGLVILCAWGCRWLVVRYLDKMTHHDSALPLRWKNSIKNLINLFVVISLIIIWLYELQFVALSIAAFVVALVIATKEVIQCFIGTLYQVSNRSFAVGDWIKVGSNQGEVVSSDWLGTKLLEVDIDSSSYTYTGKTLYIPNNLFITQPILNLNFMRRYVVHSFTIVRDADVVDLCTFKNQLLEKANEYCSEFAGVAQRYNGLIERRLDVPLQGPEASVQISTTSLGKNQMTISIFCPTSEAAIIEQKLMCDFMSLWYDALNCKRVEN